mmetsp:Transcript_20061/g.46319  ORF Transcript_20061/g.46319 Transcript_20061/m.46319 type:complete len:480 (-) Transcript_20061:337-1776(-)
MMILLLSAALPYADAFTSPCHNAAAQPRALSPRLSWLDAGGLSSEAALIKARETALIDWLQDNGVHLSTTAGWGRAAHPLRVESDTVDDFEPSGRGILARKSITQGEPIITINTKLVMTKQVAQQVLGEEVVDDGMGEYIALALLLVYERARGDDSFWAPYINILPTAEEVGQSFTWNDDELALLQGSEVVSTTRSFQAKLQAEYATVQQRTALASAAGRELAEALTWEAFLWAMSMLFSRGIDLKKQQALALVPYADLLNHSPYSTSYFMENGIPFSSEKEVVLYADRNYARNDQVLISYGQKSNAELLLLYGFVVDRNLFDQVELAVSISDEDPRFDEKEAFLSMQGLKTKLSFPLLIDRYSSELMQFLRLGCVTPADGPLGALVYNKPISPENERDALEALRAGCERTLSAYPETEEEDAKLMENSRLFATLSRRQRMAVRLRRNEKRILLRTIRVCDTALSNLETQPFEELTRRA